MTGVNYAVYTAGTPLLTKKLVFHEKRSNRGPQFGHLNHPEIKRPVQHALIPVLGVYMTIFRSGSFANNLREER
jgi:hypothetical protein